MTAALVRGNALHIPLADGSVHLSVTSPPYFALRSYQDGGEHYDGQLGSEPTPDDFLRAQWAVADEVYRVLAPDGSAWWNYGDKYAGSGGNNNSNLGERATKRGPRHYNQAADVLAKSLMGLPWRFVLGLINPLKHREPIDPSVRECWHDEDPCTVCRRSTRHPQWILRRDQIWSKPNGLPESVNDRCRSSHEYWFHLTKQGRYFAALDEVREPHIHKANGAVFGGKKAESTSELVGASARRQGNNTYDELNPLGKLPGSVWAIPSEPLVVPIELGIDHFAAFPQEWPRRLILGWSPSGICTACGEGRRPVVETSLAVKGETTGRTKVADLGEYGNDRGWNGAGYAIGSTEATITGYACACPDTSAPTRPAVVLDPFGGTGTTAMVARALGRFGVHMDLSRDYLRLARWRVFESGHADKSVDRTNRERKEDGRSDLVSAPYEAESLFGGAA